MRPATPSLLLVTLVAVIVAACASTAPLGAPDAIVPSAIARPSAESTRTANLDPAESPIAATATINVPTPLATSRGPNLEASDPEAARLDSGSLQLVEFFRFT